MDSAVKDLTKYERDVMKLAYKKGGVTTREISDYLKEELNRETEPGIRPLTLVLRLVMKKMLYPSFNETDGVRYNLKKP